jgi:hypothetical protein
MSQFNLKVRRVQNPNFKNGKVRIELDRSGVITMEAVLRFLLSVERSPISIELWLKLYNKKKMLLSIPFTMSLHLWEAQMLCDYMGQITSLEIIERNRLQGTFTRIYGILYKYKNLQ